MDRSGRKKSKSIPLLGKYSHIAHNGARSIHIIATGGPMTSYVDLYQANPGRILDQTEPFPSLLGLKSGQTGPTGH